MGSKSMLHEGLRIRRPEFWQTDISIKQELLYNFVRVEMKSDGQNARRPRAAVADGRSSRFFNRAIGDLV